MSVEGDLKTDIHARTPPGFVVTPQEIRQIEPFEKATHWNIYADDEFYYLSPQMPGLVDAVKENSYTAKTNGLRIRGTTRDDYERLQRKIKENGGRTPLNWSSGHVEEILASH